jgi:Flp pilus assembly protein TadB
MSFAPCVRAAPLPRAGRHLRRAGLRVGVAAAATWLATAALVAFAGPLFGAVALVAAVVVGVLGTCRLFAASGADAREERWLRAVLGGLQPYAGDEDEDLLVY